MITGGSNFDKTWLQSSQNRLAIARAREAMQVLGRALPCSVVAVSGSIVTIKFEVESAPFTLPQVTIPKAESEWIRTPTQPGDVGIAVPAETFVGGIDALGSGTADLSLQGNLSNVYFLPIARATFSAAPDQNQALIYGPDGALIETQDGSVSINLKPSGITFTVGGKTWTFNASGLTLSNSVVAETHLHTNVQPGGGESGGPVNP